MGSGAGGRTGLVLLLALTLAACAGRLHPAPTAMVLPGPGASATATAGGVRLIASARAWQGFPRDLGQALIPLLITIDNERAEAVGVRYQDIALLSPDGWRLAALPPHAVQGTVTEPVAALPYTVAQPYAFGGVYGPRAWYPWGRWGWPWYYDPGPVYARVPLPTSDMLRLALAESTVPPGGRLQGFVYFERDVRKGTPLELALTVTDPETREPLGVVRIPFVFE
jgi:hypothetical protein